MSMPNQETQHEINKIKSGQAGTFKIGNNTLFQSGGNARVFSGNGNGTIIIGGVIVSGNSAASAPVNSSSQFGRAEAMVAKNGGTIKISGSAKISAIDASSIPVQPSNNASSAKPSSQNKTNNNNNNTKNKPTTAATSSASSSAASAAATPKPIIFTGGTITSFKGTGVTISNDGVEFGDDATVDFSQSIPFTIPSNQTLSLQLSSLGNNQYTGPLTLEENAILNIKGEDGVTLDTFHGPFETTFENLANQLSKTKQNKAKK